MVELGRDPHFAQEALGADDGAQVGAKDFERDLAVVLQIAREIDGGHSAGADLALDGVAVGEGGSEALGGRHGAENVGLLRAGASARGK